MISLALLVGCGRSPVSPTPVAPSRSLTGAWSGTYLPVCPGAPNCGNIGGLPPGPLAIALLLRQDGNTLSGQINLTGWIGRVANVTGTIAPDGAMTLQGSDSWPRFGFCVPAGGWNIESWNGRYNAQTNTIDGDFTFVTQKHLSSCYYEQNLRVNATSLTLRQGVLADPTLAGHWQGSYVILKCTPVGWRDCTPTPTDSNPTLDLQLTQSGNVVTGGIQTIPFSNSTVLPVSGATSGNSTSLSLMGSRTEIVSGGTHVIRLTSWSTTLDAIGRLQGTFSYIDEIQWTSGVNQGSTWSTSYDAELRYVVRVPW